MKKLLAKLEKELLKNHIVALSLDSGKLSVDLIRHLEANKPIGKIEEYECIGHYIIAYDYVNLISV